MPEAENQPQQGDLIAYVNPIDAVGFAQISHIVVEDTELSDAAVRLYLHLLKYTRIAYGKYKCWPGNATVAQALGKSERAIRYAVKELVDRGLIVRRRRYGKSTMTLITDLMSIDCYKERAIAVLRQEDEDEDEQPEQTPAAQEPAKYCRTNRQNIAGRTGKILPVEEHEVEEHEMKNMKQVGAQSAPTVPVSDLPQLIFDLEELEELNGNHVSPTKVCGICESCNTMVSQETDVCPGCKRAVVWKNSKAWDKWMRNNRPNGGRWGRPEDDEGRRLLKMANVRGFFTRDEAERWKAMARGLPRDELARIVDYALRESTGRGSIIIALKVGAKALATRVGPAPKTVGEDEYADEWNFDIFADRYKQDEADGHKQDE